MSIISMVSDDSDKFYVEQSSTEPSPQRRNTPNILNSTELSEQLVSAFNNWETSYTTMDNDTFYTSDEPRRVYWNLSSDDDLGSSVPTNPSVASSPCVTPPPPRAQKRKFSLGMSFPKDGGVSQHICEACGQMIPPTKDTPGPSNRD